MLKHLFASSRGQRLFCAKVEIFLEQRDPAKFAKIRIFLLFTLKNSNFHKFRWVIRKQHISVLKLFILYLVPPTHKRNNTLLETQPHELNFLRLFGLFKINYCLQCVLCSASWSISAWVSSYDRQRICTFHCIENSSLQLFDVPLYILAIIKG